MKGYENRIICSETLNALRIRVENLVIASTAGVDLGTTTFELIQLQTRAAIHLKDEGLDEEGIAANINGSVKTGIRQGLEWSRIHLHFEDTQMDEMWRKLIR